MTTIESAPNTSDDRRPRLADDSVSVEVVCASLRSYADDREDARENEDDVFEADYAKTILSAIESSSWLSARVAAAVAAERERIEREAANTEGRYGADDWFAVHEDVWGKRMDSAFIGAGHDERVVCEGLAHEDADTIVRAVNAARITRSGS